MRALIFNGSLDKEAFRTSRRIASYYTQILEQSSVEVEQFHLSDHQIPMFDPTKMNTEDKEVHHLTQVFTKADILIWLSPLYHGSITGAMKNALDWLELTSKNKPAYLTNKVVAFTCWSAGNQAMQGINTMDNIAKALRAWSLPYSVPMSIADLYHENDISIAYKQKMDLLAQLLIQSKS